MVIVDPILSLCLLKILCQNRCLDFENCGVGEKVIASKVLVGGTIGVL
jgi:hypothetical protein